MSGFSVLLRKETLELFRSFKLLTIVLLLTMIGFVSPLLAKYTPELIKMLGSGQYGRLRDTVHPGAYCYRLAFSVPQEPYLVPRVYYTHGNGNTQRREKQEDCSAAIMQTNGKGSLCTGKVHCSFLSLFGWNNVFCDGMFYIYIYFVW